MDADKDGKLTIQEITDSLKTHIVGDVMKEGSDISAASEAGVELFQNPDASEADVQLFQKREGQLHANFPVADANKDGFLTQDEITRLDELMKRDMTTKREEL